MQSGKRVMESCYASILAPMLDCMEGWEFLISHAIKPLVHSFPGNFFLKMQASVKSLKIKVHASFCMTGYSPDSVQLRPRPKKNHEILNQCDNYLVVDDTLQEQADDQFVPWFSCSANKT
jgi:hypothetical protein